MKAGSIVLALALTLCATATAQVQSTATEHSHNATFHHPDKIEFKSGPPSLPHGAKIAVLEGDPTKEGTFTIRVWLPDGYKIPPHTHPQTERVTVISGTFNLGMGEKFDQAATEAMPSGTFGHWPTGMKHFAW